MKPSLIAGLTLLAFSTTAGAAEQNVALASAGAVAVADSEYLGSPCGACYTLSDLDSG